jgi:DNA polymerase I-like protein with 3'-5' exonuclease and polymerase domains
MEAKIVGRGKNKTEVQVFIPFNPASPAQVLKVCKSMGLDVESTDDDAISPYYESNDFVKKILDYRKAEKQVTTYGIDFLDYVEADGKIYTSLNIGLAITGRDSSSSPNLQNIPTRTKHRECFIAGKRKKLILYDYSGQEGNIFAYLTQDPKLIGIINSGKKLYIEIAKEAFNEVITKESPRYKVIKALVLGLMYGLSVKGFARDNDVDEETAQFMFDKFFETYPVAHKYYQKMVSQNRGVSKSIIGRTAHLHPYDWQWRTHSLNNPMQMSAGDMIKGAMKRFRRTDFYKKHYPTKRVCLILQVHDEIIAEADEELAEECASVLKRCMIETAEMIHPGVVGNVSGGIIENWAQKD